MLFERIKGLVDEAKTTLNQLKNGEEDVVLEKLKGVAENAKGTVKHCLGQESVEDVIARKEKEKVANLKKAPQILAGDFRDKGKSYKFYINNDYKKPYTQSQWLDLYKELSANDDPQALSPMYNAIVVDQSGYYIRRGLELMPRIYPVRFEEGRGDEIDADFVFDPYTYHKKEQSSTSSYRGSSSYMSSSVGSTSGYTAQPSQSKPAGPKPLYPWERAQLNGAQRSYEKAASDAAKNPTSMNVAAEKRAYAEYMRVLAQYGGRQ